tara:strand:+ start:1144 stop:1506 length:363 start_codon:yes stop_codon:yes gene_type:complete
MLTEIIKFVFVGVTNVFIYLVLAFFFVGILNVDPLLANGTAYFLSAIYSYLMNSFITFKKPFSYLMLTKFLIASTFLSFCASLITAVTLHYNYDYLVSIFLIIFGLPLFSFFIHKYWSLR